MPFATHRSPTLFAAGVLASLAVSLAAGEAKLPTPATPREQPDADWKKTHLAFVETAKKGGIDLLFMGDSITHGWDTTGKAAFAKNFGTYKVANFGIGGDRCEHILYRFQNGELEGFAPKLIVLLIGTNNSTCAHKPEDTALGIRTILDTIKAKSASTKVLLLQILPRGDEPKHQASNEQVNALIAKFDDAGKGVKVLDIGAKFKGADGKLIEANYGSDHLHLSAKGYEEFAAAIAPEIKKLIGQ
jgi:lysophospholipase L1-like esterase